MEQRLRAVEDQLAIYQVISSYGYAVDGLNAEAVGDCYAEDGVYAVADVRDHIGRQRIADITRDPNHIALVSRGAAHISTLPYVVIEGDRAVATCHTMVARNGDTGFEIYRLSASRIQLSRKPGGGWQIDHRQNHMLQNSLNGSELLGRLKEGPRAT